MIDFEQQRLNINDELLSIAYNIAIRQRELELLKQRRGQLNQKIDHLDSLESMRRHYGAIELIRLCRTPCRSFRPLDIDRIMATADRSHKHG